MKRLFPSAVAVCAVQAFAAAASSFQRAPNVPALTGSTGSSTADAGAAGLRVCSLWNSSEALTAASVNHMNTIHAATAAAKIARKRNACIFDFHRIPASTRCQRRGMLPPRPDAIGFNRMGCTLGAKPLALNCTLVVVEGVSKPGDH